MNIPESTRPIQDIVRDHVTVLPNHIGLKLADNTPIEESLRILDWATTLSEQCGFMVGDVANFGQTKWGEKYTEALNQTGRASDILRYCASMSAVIPQDQRSLTPNDNDNDNDADWWKKSRGSLN
jgi:hypothetical protein